MGAIAQQNSQHCPHSSAYVGWAKFGLAKGVAASGTKTHQSVPTFA